MRIDTSLFNDAIDATEADFHAKAEQLAASKKPFIVRNYSKARDQAFCDRLAKTYALFWFEDPRRARLFMTPDDPALK